MKLFIDTNILLDVLLHREQFIAKSSHIWMLCEKGKVESCISAISINNINYILNKALDREKAVQATRIVMDVFTPVTLNAKILNQAIDAGFKDFEDAIQYISAIHAEADYLITRNVKDFPASSLSVLTPESFLALNLPL